MFNQFWIVGLMVGKMNLSILDGGLIIIVVCGFLLLWLLVQL